MTIDALRAEEEGMARIPGGGEIAYQIHGRAHGGVPLLLIRPLGGSMALWGSFRTLLAADRRVIAFDPRGCGLSSAAPPWVSTPGLAEDGLRVLDHLEVSRAHVFGISLGGMTATWLALLAPERVGRLCLASTPARGLALTHAGVRRELRLAACLARPLAEVERCLVDRILSPQFRRAHPDEARRIEQQASAEPTSSRLALAKLALAGLLHDAQGELQRIVAPTLVLAGEHDSLLGTEPPRRLAARIPSATFENRRRFRARSHAGAAGAHRRPGRRVPRAGHAGRAGMSRHAPFASSLGRCRSSRVRAASRAGVALASGKPRHAVA